MVPSESAAPGAAEARTDDGTASQTSLDLTGSGLSSAAASTDPEAQAPAHTLAGPLDDAVSIGAAIAQTLLEHLLALNPTLVSSGNNTGAAQAGAQGKGEHDVNHDASPAILGLSISNSGSVSGSRQMPGADADEADPLDAEAVQTSIRASGEHLLTPPLRPDAVDMGSESIRSIRLDEHGAAGRGADGHR